MHCTTPEHEPHSLSYEYRKRLSFAFLLYVCPQRKYTPFGKTLYIIYCEASHIKLFVRARLKKMRNLKKENIMGLRDHLSPQVGLIFLLGLPFKTEILTLEIVTCKLLAENYNDSFFQFRFVCGIFFLIT